MKRAGLVVDLWGMATYEEVVCIIVVDMETSAYCHCSGPQLRGYLTGPGCQDLTARGSAGALSDVHSGVFYSNRISETFLERST